MGQHFLLQIQVQGTDQPDPMDISALEADFSVSEAGGGASNSTSVSIVNGRMTQQVRRGYNFNYRLAARRAGSLQIPALVISAGGNSARTVPIALRVMPPQENDDFKLRLSLSEARAYVGQAVTLTVEWYLAREVREYSFAMPVLEDRRFEIVEPPATASGQRSNDEVEIQLGDRRAKGRTSAGQLDGRRYTVLRFQKLLIPREAGSIRLPAATVNVHVAAAPGSRAAGICLMTFLAGGLFSGAFGGGPVLETLAIPSGRPSLRVLDLPAEGRPTAFNGWIGKFELQSRRDACQCHGRRAHHAQLGGQGLGSILHASPARAGSTADLGEGFQGSTRNRRGAETRRRPALYPDATSPARWRRCDSADRTSLFRSRIGGILHRPQRVDSAGSGTFKDRHSG